MDMKGKNHLNSNKLGNKLYHHIYKGKVHFTYMWFSLFTLCLSVVSNLTLCLSEVLFFNFC